jgi:hypothetical protein
MISEKININNETTSNNIKIDIINETTSNNIKIDINNETKSNTEEDIKKAKENSCCYKYCKCCCVKREQNNRLNDCFDSWFWYWYWYWTFSSDNSNSDSDSDLYRECCFNCDYVCTCDCDCDCDCDD